MIYATHIRRHKCIRIHINIHVDIRTAINSDTTLT